MGRMPDAGGETMARATGPLIMGEIFLTLATAADAVPPAPKSEVLQILAWVTGFVSMVLVAVFTFLKPLWLREGRKQEQARLQGNVTIDGEVATKERPEFVTRGELTGHVERIESSIQELKDDRDEARKVAREALGKVHLRINETNDAIGETNKELGELNGEVKGIGDNVGRLLDLALGRPPGTTTANQRKRTSNG